MIAHRGFSSENPENTLISYENAIKADADMDQPVKIGKMSQEGEDGANTTEEAAIVINEPVEEELNAVEGAEKSATDAPLTEAIAESQPTADPETERALRLRAATKRLRNAYISARRRYQIPQKRIDRTWTALAPDQRSRLMRADASGSELVRNKLWELKPQTDAQRWLHAGWKTLQRWAYPAAILVLIHWAALHNWGSWVPAAVHFGPLIGLWSYRLWYWYLRPRQVAA